MPNPCTTSERAWPSRKPSFHFSSVRSLLSCGRLHPGLLDAHLLVFLTIMALIFSVFSGIFFIHNSFLLQHLAAICEWVFVIDILVFYSTFTYEFGAVFNDTMVATLQHSNSRGCKSPGGSSSTSTHLNCNPESIAMI